MVTRATVAAAAGANAAVTDAAAAGAAVADAAEAPVATAVAMAGRSTLGACRVVASLAAAWAGTAVSVRAMEPARATGTPARSVRDDAALRSA
ncbi:hypothetical protein [Microbacterium hibisci]|uniref:hypothetical protein n=1 Tax=Microbacterium hibisci TaxID=2036000 RepID=UPI0027D9FCA6|nr:hypothetical protein [Microbacterium hibisci]